MAFNVFDDSNQGGVFVVCIITAPLCILATILRFVMTKRTGRKVGWEDWFAFLALPPYLFWVAYALYATIEQNGKNVFTPGALTPAQVNILLRVGYVVNPMYSVNQTFAKLSLLVLYHRLFSVDDKFRYLTYCVGVAQICWFLASFWIRWFMCTPVRKVWAPATPGHCINSNVLLAAGESVNVLIDLVMVGMAVYMVSQLRVSTWNRAKLSVLFVLGGFSGIIGIVRISQAYSYVARNSSDLVWIILQMATSIICCCAPIYRSVLPQMQVPLFRSMVSSVLPLFRSSRSGSSNKSDPSVNENKNNNNNLRNYPPFPPTIGGSEPGHPKPAMLKGGMNSDWVPLSSFSSSTRELSTQVYSQHNEESQTSPSSAAEPEATAGGYPLRTVELHQRVDHV